MNTKTNFSPTRSGAAGSGSSATNSTRPFFIVLLFILAQSALLHSQMNNWVMPPFSFDVTQSAAVPNALYSGAPVSGAYGVSNGAYDQNGGSLLFYVEDLAVKDPSGTQVGSLGYGNYWGQLGGEIVILPYPGVCRRFYVIYSIGPEVLYTIVDCSGASVQLDKGNGFGSSGTGFLIGSFSYYGVGLAGSRRTTHASYPGYVFYLYMVNSGKVSYSIVGGTGYGITAPSQIYSSSNIHPNYDNIGSGWFHYPTPSTEVELSANGQYLAFNGVDSRGGGHSIQNSGNVEIVHLSTPISASYYYNYSVNDAIIYGLELVGSGTPDLFVAGEIYFGGPGANTAGIFHKVDITGTNQPLDLAANLPGAPYSWQYESTKTFLEYSLAGRICYISMYAGNRYFVEYDDSNGSFTGTQIDDVSAGLDVWPNATSFTRQDPDYYYTLPDQVDGENYNAFTTTPFSGVEFVTVNGLPVVNGDETACDFNEVYNCNPIDLVAHLANNFGDENSVVCESSIDVHEVDKDCNRLVGTGYFNCDGCGGEGLADDSPYEVDIRDFSASDGRDILYLSSHTGYFIVTWNITDCCGNRSSRTAHIRILGSLVSTNLQIYDNNAPNPGNPWLAASTSISSPVNVGSASIGYQVAQSTGNITSYTAKIEEVDNTGAVTGAGTIYNKTINTTNITGIGVQNLNALCVATSVWPTPNPTFGQCSSTGPSYSGFTGYWSFTNGQNCYQKRYKITVTLSNPCSSSSAYSYVYVGSIGNRMANMTGIEQLQEKAEPLLFPNPATNELFISTPGNTSEGFFNVELVDLTGRSILQYSGKQAKDAQAIDISQLSAGVYLWKYQSEGKSSVGKIQVVK